MTNRKWTVFYSSRSPVKVTGEFQRLRVGGLKKSNALFYFNAFSKYRAFTDSARSQSTLGCSLKRKYVLSSGDSDFFKEMIEFI